VMLASSGERGSRKKQAHRQGKDQRTLHDHRNRIATGKLSRAHVLAGNHGIG
jgi:hypothetical protein